MEMAWLYESSVHVRCVQYVDHWLVWIWLGLVHPLVPDVVGRNPTNICMLLGDGFRHWL